MASPKDRNDTILADWTNIELEASWGPPATIWARMFTAMMRTRHAVSVSAIAAVVVVVWIAGIRAYHTGILVVTISSITVVAICTELIGNKRYGQQRRKSEAEPGDASQDERTAG